MVDFTQQLQAIGQLIDQGQLQQAALALNEAQKQHPKDARVALVGVRLAERAGNLPGAVQAARRAVALEPGWFVAVTELALQLAAQGQFSEAMEHARHAVALAPKEPRVLHAAANVAEGAGNRRQALTWAQTALQLDPQNHPLRLDYAGMLYRERQYKQAQDEYNRVLQAQPGNENALKSLLTCALQLGDQSEAQRLADVLIIRSPDDEQVR